jgi:hypothetical protein
MRGPKSNQINNLPLKASFKCVALPYRQLITKPKCSTLNKTSKFRVVEVIGSVRVMNISC